jgi:hypothetical protein
MSPVMRKIPSVLNVGSEARSCATDFSRICGMLLGRRSRSNSCTSGTPKTAMQKMISRHTCTHTLSFFLFLFLCLSRSLAICSVLCSYSCPLHSAESDSGFYASIGASFPWQRNDMWLASAVLFAVAPRWMTSRIHRPLRRTGPNGACGSMTEACIARICSFSWV